MMTYTSLAGAQQSWILILLFLACMVCVGCIFVSFFLSEKNSMRARIKLFGLFLVNFVILTLLFHRLQWSLLFKTHTWGSEFAGGLPVWLLIVLPLGSLAILAWYIYKKIKYLRTQITVLSIKTAMDSLPDGILICAVDGQVFLTNKAMNALSNEIQMRPISNGKIFWDELTALDPYSDNVQVTYHSRADEKVWSFTKTAYEENGDLLIKIVATDISQLIRMSQELADRNEKLRIQNLRLQHYSVEVDRVVRERERLEIKERIHREIGSLLLASRHAVTVEDAATRERAFAGWELLDQAIRRETPKQMESDAWRQLQDAAGSAGVTLTLEGELPSDSGVLSFFSEAAAEVIVNAVKHADATCVNIRIEKWKDAYQIVFANNGRQPEQIIEPRGGLASIRDHLEMKGGEFQIRTTPEYQLCLTVPQSF